MPFILWLMARLTFGLNAPKKNILGAEFAGEVEAIGKQVTRFKLGDAVFGYRGPNLGTNAEYICAAEDGLIAPKPTNMSFEEATAVPYGALTALSLLRKATIQPGQQVLILGASGSIGSAAVQIAKHFGAEVTGVCSTSGLAYVKSIGADAVIDYTHEDFTKGEKRYDLIFDVLGRGSFGRSKRVLKTHGQYLLASFKMKQVLQMLWTSMIGSQKVVCALSMEKPNDLMVIKELVEAGKIKTLIDRCYPLEQTADAHRYVENGHRKGSVVIALVHG